jgi:hypothetical protein
VRNVETLKITRTTPLKILCKSSFSNLKNEMEKYPEVFNVIRRFKIVVIVVKRFKYPYSAGEKYLAKIIIRKKLTPLLKNEKNENITPFRNSLLFKYLDIIIFISNQKLHLIIVNY